MSRVFGIDLRDKHVRIAAVRAGYRKLELEALAEELLASHETTEEAIQACLAKMPSATADAMITAVNGSRVFSHRIALPESARKRLRELLPFELEASLPVDVEDLAIDSSLISNERGGPGQELSIFAVAARLPEVQAAIDLISDATKHQPERVGVSSAELGHLNYLIPSLPTDEAIAVVDMGFDRTDVCIVREKVTAMVRTITGGISGFPEAAENSVSSLRQTLRAYGANTGHEVNKIYVVGEGAGLKGLSEFLASRLEVEVLELPAFELEGMSEHDRERVPLFARALGTAMHGVRGKGLDLRQGPLAFERGYEHLKARAPLSAALIAAVLLSFLFAVWAESQALAAEKEALLSSLEQVTQSTFGKGTSDADDAENELAKARKLKPDDPMRYMDGLGAAVALAETMPEGLKHDVEEFDFDQGKDLSKGKLQIRGQVDSAEDAQKVAHALNEHRCISEAKMTKITQVVNSERERYVLEAEVECPEDPSAGKSKKSKSGATP